MGVRAMVRLPVPWVVALGLALGLALAGGAARAGAAADRLGDVLRLDEVIEVMRDEGLAFGADLDADVLGGQGGRFWQQRVEGIYDTAYMNRTVRAALAEGLDEEETALSLAFFESPLGQRILTLETSARRALADPEVEAAARDVYADMKKAGDARLSYIARLIEVNDLLERNVAGALGSSYHFLRGLSEGGAGYMTEEEMLADVWSQEEETREDTESWLYGFLLMAYRPLSDEELEAYIGFSGSPAGRALNAALFDGFDGMYLDISYALGLMVARTLEASDL